MAYFKPTRSTKQRISASFVRKFAPDLNRISTPEGRRWVTRGRKFLTLNDVVEGITPRGAGDSSIAEAAEILPVQEEASVEVYDNTLVDAKAILAPGMYGGGKTANNSAEVQEVSDERPVP